MQSPIEYRSSSTPSPRPHRTAGTWIALLGVWFIGIVMWAIYVALGAFVFFRVF